MAQIVDGVLKLYRENQFSIWQDDILNASVVDERFGKLLSDDINRKKLAEFFKVWETLDRDTPYSILLDHLVTAKAPSSGYVDLAYLIGRGFFNVVLSTNLDNLLERSLIRADLLTPDDFIVVVNGRDRPEEVKDQLDTSRQLIKIVKLHGTLESPQSYAFTPDEVFDFEKTIRPSLAKIINESLIIVGHSMQDRDLDVLFEEEGKEIYYINPSPVELGSRIDHILRVRGYGNVVIGPEAVFDTFLGELRKQVDQIVHTAKSDAGLSVEGFLKAVGYEKELHTGRSRFANLPALYVKPNEYREILKKLEQEHLVFIVGEPHVGKTYTALHVLWEHYRKGYDIQYLQHDQLIHLLHLHDGDIKSLLLELFKPDTKPRIVYFDDPFGETLERRTDIFAKNLEYIIDFAKSYEQLRLIVTTRLNVFEEVLGSRTLSSSVMDVVKTLRIHTSYDSSVLLDILRRYIEFYKPLWGAETKITNELNEKLPDLLVAPHNIEFFVRTSELLTTTEDVIAHVQESKKIVEALATWMRRAPVHEHLFLIWLEICSTASILFPDSSASRLKLEEAYQETLAYWFKKGYLTGIPVMPFANTLEKFRSIVFERQETEGSPVKLDFVHPSYHEAFWRAKNQGLPFSQWWEILKQNIKQILRDCEENIDIVQLNLIEQFAATDRDIDRLLLLSAHSGDPNEQLIALGHMFERYKRFSDLPELIHCFHSVCANKERHIRTGLVELINRHFAKLPIEITSHVFPFIFSDDGQVRQAALGMISANAEAIKHVEEADKALLTWKTIRKLYAPMFDTPPLQEDWVYLIISKAQLKTMAAKNADGLSPAEIEMILSVDLEDFVVQAAATLKESWTNLAEQQKEQFVCGLLTSTSRSLKSMGVKILTTNYRELSHLSEQLPLVRELAVIQEVFKIDPADARSLVQIIRTVPVDWSRVPDQKLLEMLSFNSIPIGKEVAVRVLRDFDNLVTSQQDNIIRLALTPSIGPNLSNAAGELGWSFPNISNEQLLELTRVPGRVQYDALLGLLIRFDSLSESIKELIEAWVNLPPGAWIGGSIAQVASSRFDEELAGSIPEAVAQFPFRLQDNSNKTIVGALLGELSQYEYDSNIGLQERYLAILNKLAKEADVVKYAFEWLDYQKNSYYGYPDSYWQKVKDHIRGLPSQSRDQ